MKFLANENIPKRALDLLREHGIDVVSVLDVATGLSDLEVLGISKDQGRILLTFDKDFGNLVFKADVKAEGVLLLRLRPSSPEQIAEKLKALIATGIQLDGHFVVMNEQRVRVSRLVRLR
jgi:predicted nuclease of predicted toxin-antitoxin system